MFVAPSVWFCCLKGVERIAVLNASIIWTASLYAPIEDDAFWTLVSGSELVAWAGQDAFLATYGLERTVIVIPDEPPIPAVGIANLPLWIALSAFMASGSMTCADGCDVPTWALP